jgi:hypothetical protein
MLKKNKEKNEHESSWVLGSFTQQSESLCRNGPLYKASKQWVTKNKRSVQRLEKCWVGWIAQCNSRNAKPIKTKIVTQDWFEYKWGSQK